MSDKTPLAPEANIAGSETLQLPYEITIQPIINVRLRMDAGGASDTARWVVGGAPAEAAGSQPMPEGMPQDAESAFVALSRTHSLATLLKTSQVVILPLTSIGSGSAQAGYRIAPRSLESLASRRQPGTEPAEVHCPDTLAVAFVPTRKVPRLLADRLPPCEGIMVLAPGQVSTPNQTDGALRFSSALTGRPDGAEGGVIALDVSGRLVSLPPTGTENVVPAVAGISEPPPTRSAHPAHVNGTDEQEYEILRTGPVILHQPAVSSGRYHSPAGGGLRRVTTRHWIKKRYDGLMLTSKRLIFVRGGMQERVLCLDPAVARRILASTPGVAWTPARGTRLESSDQTSFLYRIEARQIIFRQIPMPRRVRTPLTMIVLLLSLVIFIAAFKTFGLVPAFLVVLLLTKGVPAPWQSVQIFFGTAREILPVVNNPFAAAIRQVTGTYRLEVPDHADREKLLAALGPPAEAVRSAFNVRETSD